MTTEARQAEPLLASSLLGDEALEGLVEGICRLGPKRRTAGHGLRTGVKSLDDALDGGLRGGSVVGIWGEGTGGSEICRTLLVQSLLKHPDSTAAVVDTTGNFDVLRLYTLILSQLRQGSDVLLTVRAATRSEPETAVEDVAAKLLDQVKIMRVFDFVGVSEAIGEIRNDLEGKKSSSRKKKEAEPQPMAKARSRTPEPRSVPKRTVVADSEDEDEDEEEMLFDTSPAPVEPAPAVQQPVVDLQQQATIAQDEAEAGSKQDAPKGEGAGKVKLILIDNLAQVINPLLKKDYIQANALSSTFLYSLNHLTRTHTLHTILANPATHPRAPSPMRPTPNQPPLPPEHQTQQPPPSLSIFASSIVVPSLASVLPRYVDVSLLVSQMPRKKMDARVFYRDGNDGNRGFKKLRGVEMVSVMEVVSDRWEGRVGAWGTFTEGEKGIRDVS